MSSATLVVPWSVCRVRSGAKVPAKAWWSGLGQRVADVGAGDQGADAAQRLLVDEQFQEELPQRLGGRVVSAPQRPLGSGVEQRALGGEVAFVVVGVQQAGRRPAVDRRRPASSRG